MHEGFSGRVQQGGSMLAHFADSVIMRNGQRNDTSEISLCEGTRAAVNIFTAKHDVVPLCLATPFIAEEIL